jgi:Rha family phage regulatory protein
MTDLHSSNGNLTSGIDATRQPVVFRRDGEVFASSRDVAVYFGKDLKHVHEAVRNLSAKDQDWARLNFRPNLSNDLTGSFVSDYDMTRDGFTILAMGFTGEKALRFKLAYIAAFNAMEAELRTRPAALDFSDPKVLISLLTEHTAGRIAAEKRAEVAEAKIEEVRPKAQFFDRYVNAEGLYGLQNAGRIIGDGANKFVSRLKAGYLHYQGGALVPKAAYRDMGLFEVKATMVDDKARYQTYVTPKGLDYFARKFNLTPPAGRSSASQQGELL